MQNTRILAAILLLATVGACAQPGPQTLQPGQRIVLTDRTTGKRVETTFGTLTAFAAMSELRNRNYGRAIAIASQALRGQSLTPQERSLNHTVRAVAYRILNNPIAARVDLDAAITHDPRNLLAWTERGILNAAQRLYADALSDLNRSIEIRPTTVAHFERGRVHFLQRRFPAARADLDQAIALKPDFGAAFLLRGLTHHVAGAYALARADYQQALALDPENGGARQALALLQRRAPAPPLPPSPPQIQQF